MEKLIQFTTFNLIVRQNNDQSLQYYLEDSKDTFCNFLSFHSLHFPIEVTTAGKEKKAEEGGSSIRVAL